MLFDRWNQANGPAFLSNSENRRAVGETALNFPCVTPTAIVSFIGCVPS
jgi:hypothetical protein